MYGIKNEKSVLASYEFALLIATNGQPHTIRKDLILPAAKAITKNLFSEKHVDEVSENTVKKRIDELDGSLPVHTTPEALLKVVNDFITTNNLQWGKCVGISTGNVGNT
jgi:hypothetical protein